MCHKIPRIWRKNKTKELLNIKNNKIKYTDYRILKVKLVSNNKKIYKLKHKIILNKVKLIK